MTTAAFGGCAVGLAGGLVFGWWLRRRRARRDVVVDAVLVDDSLDRDIDLAARKWAESHGRPELAGLLADKVRLAWSLQHSDDQSGGSR